MLKIPIGDRQYYNIPLNTHTLEVLSDPTLQVRSFTLAISDVTSVSICYTKEVPEMIDCMKTEGIDRNLRNLTVGNHQQVMQYDLSKTIKIAENTQSIIASFKRHDVRRRKMLAAKYGKRKRNRVNQMIHHVSKSIIQSANENRSVLVLEDISNIRNLYRKGNGQGKKFRGLMNNSWSFAEIERQIKYKAKWESVRIIQLSKEDTKGTSKLCPQCGKRTQVAARTDLFHRRQLWCLECKRWMDRDVVAAMNLSIRGWSKFDHSEGAAGEAMVQEPKEIAILKVDAAKLNLKRFGGTKSRAW